MDKKETGTNFTSLYLSLSLLPSRIFVSISPTFYKSFAQNFLYLHFRFELFDSGNAVLRKTFTPPPPHHPHPPKKWTRNVVKKPNKNFSNVTQDIWISSNRQMKCAPNKTKQQTLSKAE
jgi:hypothetical protein